MEPFIGEVRLMSFGFAPKGWAICDGSILQVHDNPRLFALISNYFGGDGVKTFGLPNLAGRIVIGMGEGQGMEQYTLAEAGGAAMVTLTANQLGTHSHALPVSTHGQAGKVPGPDMWLAPVPGEGRTPGAPVYAPDVSAGAVPMSDGMPQPAGKGAEHNNMAPYVVMNYCMATDGIVPQRG